MTCTRTEGWWNVADKLWKKTERYYEGVFRGKRNPVALQQKKKCEYCEGRGEILKCTNCEREGLDEVNGEPHLITDNFEEPPYLCGYWGYYPCEYCNGTGNKEGTLADVTSKELKIAAEIKQSKNPPVATIRKALKQAEDGSPSPDYNPIAVFHKTNDRHDNDLVCMTLKTARKLIPGIEE